MSPSVLFSLSQRLTSGIKYFVYACYLTEDGVEIYEWMPLTENLINDYSSGLVMITKIKKDLNDLETSELSEKDISLCNQLNTTLERIKNKSIIPNRNGRIYGFDLAEFDISDFDMSEL